MDVKTVLFADDEQHNLDPLKIKIEILGFKVLTAITVAETIRLLKSNNVDVLVLDIMMDPGEGLRDKIDANLAGFQSLDLIKKTSPTTQIICLSVAEDPTMLKEIRKRGALFLGKGDTSLRKTVSIIKSKATGLTTDDDLRGRGKRWGLG